MRQPKARPRVSAARIRGREQRELSRSCTANDQQRGSIAANRNIRSSPSGIGDPLEDSRRFPEGSRSTTACKRNLVGIGSMPAHPQHSHSNPDHGGLKPGPEPRSEHAASGCAPRPLHPCVPNAPAETGCAPHTAPPVGLPTDYPFWKAHAQADARAVHAGRLGNPAFSLMDPIGLEPTTSSMPCRGSHPKRLYFKPFRGAIIHDRDTRDTKMVSAG